MALQTDRVKARIVDLCSGSRSTRSDRIVFGDGGVAVPQIEVDCIGQNTFCPASSKSATDELPVAE